MKLEESHARCQRSAMNTRTLPPKAADEPPSRRVYIILNLGSDRLLAGGARNL
jgi:hypothetical protein